MCKFTCVNRVKPWRLSGESQRTGVQPQGQEAISQRNRESRQLRSNFGQRTRIHWRYSDRRGRNAGFSWMGLCGTWPQAPSAPVSRDTQLPAAVCVATHTRRSDRNGGLSWGGEGTILADRPRLTGLDGKRSCHLAEGWLLREQRQQGLRLEEGQPQC